MSANATKVEPVAQIAAYWPLADAHELATILDSVLDTARTLIRADAYAVWLLERDRQEWRVAASRGLSPGFTAQVRGGADAMPATPICADDVEREALLSERLLTYRREGVRSVMAVPIFVQQQPRGTLVCYFRKPHSFSESELRSAKTPG
jgi:GAF domain-containing protein